MQLLLSMIKLFNNMSSTNLALRQRAQSTVSLRRRLIRTNSEDKTAEMKKSSTMTSFRPKLERLIQEGKIQHLMHQDTSSKANLYYTNHFNQMEKQLASTKKSLSTLLIKSRSKENSINTIKNNLKKVQREIQMMQKEAHAASQRFSGSMEGLEQKRQEYEEIFWEEKVYTHLKNRGYKDEVFLKGRYECLQRVYELECDNRKLLQNKHHELKQLNKKLKGHKSKAQKIAYEQAQDKNEFIALVEADMSERELLGQLRADKFKREAQINEIAPSLIEREQLLRILQVLYAHRILSQIIKVKSNSLINRYESANSAYNYIRSNSNIVEPDKILKRMEQHDKLYDNALKRVNALEAQLATFDANLQNCAISKNQILSQEGTPQNLPKDYYQGLQLDKYELLISQKEKLMQRQSQDEVLRLNIQAWAQRMFKQFGIAQSESNNFLDCLTDLVVRIRQQK